MTILTLINSLISAVFSDLVFPLTTASEETDLFGGVESSRDLKRLTDLLLLLLFAHTADAQMCVAF